jgi:hypothetical protein
MTTKKTTAVFQLKVNILDIEPPVWRSVQLAENTKLPRLHGILQLLFNWEDYHLHQFIAGRRVYAVPDPDDALFGLKVNDERRIPLNRIVNGVGERFDYVYDFGDNWRHQILLEAILLPSPNVFYPRCIAGARNGPPEDAGGARGYSRYLQALADPEHEEHENLLAWRGPFDGEAFSIKTINASLKRTFHRRTPSKRTGAGARAGHKIDPLAT